MAEKNSLWKNIRNKAKQNRASGATPKKPTTEMLRQERKINAEYGDGGKIKRGFLEEKEFRKEFDKYAEITGNNNNPYEIEHYYDASKLFDDTGTITGHLSNDLHLPSEYKELGHPNRFINGVDTTKEQYPNGGKIKNLKPTPLYKGVKNGPIKNPDGTYTLPTNERGEPLVNLPEFEVTYTNNDTGKTDLYGNPIESEIVNDPSLNRSYYDSRLDQMMLGNDYDQMDDYSKERVVAHENFHGRQYKNDRSTLLPVKDIPYKKPSAISTDDTYYEYHNRKPVESQTNINRFKNKYPGFKPVPDDIIYDKIVDPQQYLDTSTMEGEAKLYEDLGVDIEEYANGGYMYPDGGKIYANKEGVVMGPVQNKDGTYTVPQNSEGMPVVNLPEFNVVSTGVDSQPNPYSPVTGEEYLQSGFNPLNLVLPPAIDQQQQPIDPLTGLPKPQSGKADFDPIGQLGINPTIGNLKKGSALLKNAKQELIYNAIDPVGYGVREKLGNIPQNLVRNTFKPNERIARVGKELSPLDRPGSEVVKSRGKARLDSWRLGLGLDQKYNTFNKIGDNLYSTNTPHPTAGRLSHLYNDIQANKINSTLKGDEAKDALRNLTRTHNSLTTGEKSLDNINAIREYLKKSGDLNFMPWEQSRIVEKARNPKFTHSVYDADPNGIMGQHRFDVTDLPDNNIHFQANDTWDLHPFADRGVINVGQKIAGEEGLKGIINNKLKNVEALKVLGGKPFNIQDNFIINPNTMEVIKRFNKGGYTNNTMKYKNFKKKFKDGGLTAGQGAAIAGGVGTVLGDIAEISNSNIEYGANGIPIKQDVNWGANIAKSTLSGAGVGASFGGVGAAVGAGVGALWGVGKSLIQKNKSNNQFEDALSEMQAANVTNGNNYVNTSLQAAHGGNITNNSLTLQNNMYNKYKSRYAQGGTFDQNGINFISEKAGLHHQNAYGGVPIGPDALAEGGEAKLQMADGGQYIVSGEVDGANTQSIDGQTMTQRLKKDLKKYMIGGLATNSQDKENLKRPFDSYSLATINQIKDKAIQETEAIKKMTGGALQYAAHGGKLTKDIEKIVMEEYAAAYGGMLPNKYKGKVNMPGSYAKGGIYIDESKKGTFTAAATKHGKSVQEFAREVLANKDNYSSGMVKKANFAHNAAGWKHAYGGPIDRTAIPGDPASRFNYTPSGDMYPDGGLTKPWQAPIPIGSNVQQGSNSVLSAGYGDKDLNNTQFGSRIINEYGNGLPNDTSYIYQSPKEDYFYNTGQNTQDGKPVSNYNSGSVAPLGNNVYQDNASRFNYTPSGDMYAAGGPFDDSLYYSPGQGGTPIYPTPTGEPITGAPRPNMQQTLAAKPEEQQKFTGPRNSLNASGNFSNTANTLLDPNALINQRQANAKLELNRIMGKAGNTTLGVTGNINYNNAGQPFVEEGNSMMVRKNPHITGNVGVTGSYNKGNTSVTGNLGYDPVGKTTTGTVGINKRWARGGEMDYTNDVYSMYADGGMMADQQMMQEQQMQQAPQEQMQQQGGQDQMMQMVQQVEEAIMQGAQPEQVMQQVMQELVQSGTPKEQAMQQAQQVVQMAMQDLQSQQSQMQEQPMQGQEQMMPQQGMASGGRMYAEGDYVVKPPYAPGYNPDPLGLQAASDQYEYENTNPNSDLIWKQQQLNRESLSKKNVDYLTPKGLPTYENNVPEFMIPSDMQYDEIQSLPHGLKTLPPNNELKLPNNKILTYNNLDSKKSDSKKSISNNDILSGIGIASGLVGPMAHLLNNKKPKPFNYKLGQANTLNPSTAIALANQASREAQATADYGIKTNAPTSGSFLANLRANALQSGLGRGRTAAGITQQYDIGNADILNRFEELNTGITNKGIDERRADLGNWRTQKTNAAYNLGANLQGSVRDIQANKIDEIIAKNIGTTNYKYDPVTQTITYPAANGQIVTVPASTVVGTNATNLGTGQMQSPNAPQIKNSFQSNLDNSWKKANTLPRI